MNVVVWLLVIVLLSVSCALVVMTNHLRATEVAAQSVAPGQLLLFIGARYYPNGGAEDFLGFFDSVEAAKAGAGPLTERDFANVADQEMKIVCHWSTTHRCRGQTIHGFPAESFEPLQWLDGAWSDY